MPQRTLIDSSSPREYHSGDMPGAGRKTALISLVFVVCALMLLLLLNVLPLHRDSSGALPARVEQLTRQGRYAEATPLAEEALRKAEAEFGAEHTETAMELNNLATLYQKQGRYPDAEPLFQRCLRIQERALGLEHPDVAITLANYALLLRKTGRVADAVKMETRARAIRAMSAKLQPPANMAATAPAAGAASEKRFYVNDQIGIKILLPADWQLTSEIKGPPNQPLIVTLGRPGVLVQVTLTREVLEATPDIYKNLLKRNFSQQAEDSRELSDEKVTQGGLEGSKIAFSIKANNVTHRLWLLIFSKGNQHFWIAAAAPDAYFDAHKATFQEMFDSIEFPGLANKPPSATEEAVGPSKQYSGATGQITSSPAAEVARLREKVAQNPEDYTAHMELGNALDDGGDTDAAIAEYKVALRLNPVYPQTHGNLGASYIRKEDWKAADSELREAVRLEPDYLMAHFRLAYVLVRRDDPEGAYNEFRETFRIDPEQARALIFREFPALAQTVQQEIKAAPADAVARLYIALQLIRVKKNCHTWVRQLDDAVRIAPQFTFAQELRKEGRMGCK